MATAATIKKNIAKLEAALKSKATPKSLKSKLEAQLVKSKAELSGINKGTKPKTSSNKSTQTALQKLKEMVNKNKKLKTYKKSGVDLEKDADRPAKPIGKRTAKSGNTYYEYRANRIDVKQPPKRYPKLEKGGYMAEGGKVAKYKLDDMVYSYQNKDYAAPINYIKFSPWDSNSGSHPNDTYKYRLSLKDGHSNWIDEKSLYKTKQKEYASGGYMAKGGKAKTSEEKQIEKAEKSLEYFKKEAAGGNEYAKKNIANLEEYIKELKENKYAEGGGVSHKYYVTYASQGFDGKNYKNGFDLYSTNGDADEEIFIGNYSKLEEANKVAENKGLERLPMYMRMAKGGVSEKPIPAIMDKYGNVKSEKLLEQELEYLKEAYEDKLVTKDEYEKSYNEIKEQIKFLQKKEKGGYYADGGETAKFQVDDVVYHKGHNTIGIVRLEEERGELKTDADGNVDVDELEYYNPLKHEAHKNAKIAPSTKKEIEERMLWKPFTERTSKLAKGGYYAKGGLTEHGLKVGDTIVDDMFWDKSVKVLNSKTGYAVVKIETGERTEMKAMGGEMHRTQE